MALQHPGKAVAMLRRRRPDGNGAGHVGGAIEILTALIHQIERAGLERPVAFGRDAVMHDGAIGRRT